MKTKEVHPFLNEGNIKGATKLILGSFPVYACTNPDKNEKQKLEIPKARCGFSTVVVKADFGDCTNHTLTR